MIQQYLNVGVVEELEIALVRFYSGQRLFENLVEPGSQSVIEKITERPSNSLY